MNVLSLFDGMSCGRIALDRAGIPVTNYYASEIDKYAIQVAKKNWPGTVHLGDVRDVMWPETFEGQRIDLLLGGSPCQGFSFAGKRLNFDDPRSKLFFEYVRILKEAQPRWFLLENVRMKQESQDIISDMLGVKPVAINSSLVSAQNRYRLYWTNIPFDMPADKGLVMRDILEDNTDTERERASGLVLAGHAADIKGHSYNRRVYHPDGKAPSLCAASGGNLEPKILQKARGWNKGGLVAKNGKAPSITTSSWEHNNHLTFDEGLTWRKLTPIECERLQTVPDNYTEGVSNTQRYRMLGNGWTVDVITHILRGIGGN